MPELEPILYSSSTYLFNHTRTVCEMPDHIDYLAVCAHPDDAELTCAGLLMRAKDSGYSIGVVDLSRGELGSRGSVTDRDAEASAAATVMALDVRYNLELPDGNIVCSRENVIRLVELIRRWRPRMLITSYWEDHHPDHVQTSKIATDAWWFAGVANYPGGGIAHRPERILYYQGRGVFPPSCVVDITSTWERKKSAIACYHSQLHRNTAESEPKTYTSSENFMDLWEGRHRYLGSLIGTEYGEAYHVRTPVPVFDIASLTGGAPGVL